MAALEEILSGVDLTQVASTLGEDPAHVQTAATRAVSTLLGGLEQNMADPQGAVGIASALGQHVGDTNAAPQTGPVDLQQLDVADDSKIVNHILPAGLLGQQAGSQGGGGGVLGQILGGGPGAQQAQRQHCGLGDVLGQVLGDQSSASQPSAAQGTPSVGGLLKSILFGS